MAISALVSTIASTGEAMSVVADDLVGGTRGVIEVGPDFRVEPGQGFLCRGLEVLAAGRYMEEGKVRPSDVAAPPAVWRWAAEVCREWLPAETCVLDLAENEIGELRALEFNCIHASGFYRLDRNAIARSLESAWQ